MWLSKDWKDYAVLAAGDGQKLERWGSVVLLRPDPQAIWPMDAGVLDKTPLHARYVRSSEGGGEWEFYKKVPNSWNIRYKNLTFSVHPTGFKHTGLFPEQAANWDFLQQRIREARGEMNVLNLFAYTGAATLAEIGRDMVRVPAYF